MNRTLFLVGLALVAAGALFLLNVTTTVNYYQTGVASWYGPNFQGNRTANGEIFDMNKMTAAHKTLPFDTIVKVHNLDNGRNVTVRINDRGPFIKGRIIDLSRQAARELDMIGPGTARVGLEIIQWP